MLRVILGGKIISICRQHRTAKGDRRDPGFMSWIFLQVLIRHQPKSAQHMLVIEFTRFEVGGAAERNGTGVTKQLPLSLCRLDRNRRTRTVYGCTLHKVVVDAIESQCHEMSDFGHQCPPCELPGVPGCIADYRAHCIGGGE